MSLSPELPIPEINENQEVQTSRTYRYNYETGKITNEIISGLEALKQFVYFQLRTRRYLHPIYSGYIGQEFTEVLSDKEVTMQYKLSELPRLIEECLIYDDRVDSVHSFNIIQEDDNVYVEFVVSSVEGDLEIREVIENVRAFDV